MQNIDCICQYWLGFHTKSGSANYIYGSKHKIPIPVFVAIDMQSSGCYHPRWIRCHCRWCLTLFLSAAFPFPRLPHPPHSWIWVWVTMKAALWWRSWGWEKPWSEEGLSPPPLCPCVCFTNAFRERPSKRARRSHAKWWHQGYSLVSVQIIGLLPPTYAYSLQRGCRCRIVKGKPVL